MVIKINDYYKVNIDSIKKFFVNKNYSLKYIYISYILYILNIINNFISARQNVKITTIIIYTLPLLVGAIIELFAVKIYNKNIHSEFYIKYLLYFSLIKIINIYLFLISAYLGFMHSSSSNYIVVKFLYGNDLFFIKFLFITLLLSIINFFVSIKCAKSELSNHKKNKIIPMTLCIFLTYMVIFFVMRSNDDTKILIVSIAPLFCSYAIGKMYFMYKNFNKIVSPDDKLIDYQL